MKRNLETLAQDQFDICIIGGGIYGACIAWDAALRGLRVALVEKGDFGQATSANSLKTIHGGLRYLQDLKPKLVRKMIRERRTWLHIAPHLVDPLPCIIPTNHGLMRSRLLTGSALKLNDLLGYDRNRGLSKSSHLPASRLLSREECLSQLPGIRPQGITGGMLWYDAQIHNTERLLLSILHSAVSAGAQIANYAEVTGFLTSSTDDHKVTGVTVADRLDDQRFEIQANLVINSAGAWIPSLLKQTPSAKPTAPFQLSTAVNLITSKPLTETAFGVTSTYMGKDVNGTAMPKQRVLFAAPWCRHTLLGTFHSHFDGDPADFELKEETISEYIDEFNIAYPGAQLRRADIVHIHHGFLPADNVNGDSDTVTLMREGGFHDHRQEGIDGLVSIKGVKYTTSREVAERTVDMVVERLGISADPCRTYAEPVCGGQMDDYATYLERAISGKGKGSSAPTVTHLVRTYGNEWHQILDYATTEPSLVEPVSSKSLVMKAEIIHALRHEMAFMLADVIMRRTELGAFGLISDYDLQTCADIMAKELQWGPDRVKQEVEAVKKQYPYAVPTGGPAAPPPIRTVKDTEVRQRNKALGMSLSPS